MLAAVVLLALATPGHAATPEEQGLAIAEKVDAERDGFGTETASYELVLIDADGVTTTREMTYWAAEVDGGEERSRIEITAPADVKGTRLLSWAQQGKPDAQWLFMPALDVTRRISGGGRTGAFMGSELSYEDLANSVVSKYSYTFVEEGERDGRKVWVYERVPLEKGSGYSKQVVTVDQQYVSPVRIDSYDRKGSLLKTMTFSGFTQVEGEWRWASSHVDNVQTGKKSTVNARQRQLGVPIDTFYFESASLAD
jgi:hypothetical protein